MKRRLNSFYHTCLKIPLLILILNVGNIELAVSQQFNPETLIGVEYTQIDEIAFFTNNNGGSARLLRNRSFSISDIVQGGRHYVFLERLLPTGRKRFKIIQTLDPGKVMANEEMDISGLCSDLNTANEYIIAIVVRDTDGEVFKNVRKAWKIDVKNGLFTPIDPKRITCINEGYGL